MRGDTEIYSVSGFGGTDKAGSANSEYPDNSCTIFDDSGSNITYKPITIKGKSYLYVPFGDDDQLPYEIIQKVADNMVMSQNKFYNVLTCYGQGVRFFDKKTKQETENEDVQQFEFRNQLNRFFIEQCTDMKYFFFTVTAIILSGDGTQIVQMRHKESCYCRFEKADEMGRIQHVFYGNFKDSAMKPDEVEVLEMLDDTDPWGDLRVRLGFDPDPKTGQPRKALASDPFGRATRTRKFAIVTRFPTPGYQYYPVPYYTAILRDSWYDIYMLIGRGKRAKIRNSAPPRFQVEVHKDYWDNLCDNEGITDPQKRRARVKQEKQNIENFISGYANELFKEITFTDMLTKPDAWGAAMNWYFGEYGKVKHQFMIDVTGEKWDDDYINSFINDYGYVTYLKSKLRTALDEENARRRAAGLGDLCEENGMLINWGQF